MLPDAQVGDHDDVEGNEVDGWICPHCNQTFWSASVYTAAEQYEDYSHMDWRD